MSTNTKNRGMYIYKKPKFLVLISGYEQIGNNGDDHCSVNCREDIHSVRPWELDRSSMGNSNVTLKSYLTLL